MVSTRFFFLLVKKTRLSTLRMSIKKLSKDVIAYVCAGVHIVDQAHAIEETIQNSLEAGATTIEVR